jgi:predicted  nucleic acid-binding Zn-ribbon protein
MNTGFQLFQLQEIDTDLDNAQLRIIEIDNLIKNDVKIINAQNNLEIAKNQLIADNNEFNTISDDIQNKKEKISQSESSLYNGSVINPKELQDLQMEISSIKKTIRKLEDVLLEVMIRVDQSENNLEIQKEVFKSTNSNFATQSSLLQGEKNNLLERIHGLNSKKLTMITQIDQDNQNRYETLRKIKNNLAITKLQDDACGACGAGLTASQRQEARSASKLFICPSCGRIIYGSS